MRPATIPSMTNIFNYPVLVLGMSLVLLLCAAEAGLQWQRVRPALRADERDDFNLLLGATLTLLGLILGFTFSMATSRYDQRKSLEEAEANAIGTEWVRADLLPAKDGTHVRDLLRHYLEERIQDYEEHDDRARATILRETGRLQNELWKAVLGPGLAQQTPTLALGVSGMNDVLNAQSYMQAAWWNRIPAEAWGLLAIMGLCANFLFAFGAGRRGIRRSWLLVLPLVLSIAFFLVADIDSPRGGLVRVQPQNLLSLQQSLP
jgi:hypothetical protein